MHGTHNAEFLLKPIFKTFKGQVCNALDTDDTAKC